MQHDDDAPEIAAVEWVADHVEAHGHLLVHGSTIAEGIGRAKAALGVRPLAGPQEGRLRVLRTRWWQTEACHLRRRLGHPRPRPGRRGGGLRRRRRGQPRLRTSLTVDTIADDGADRYVVLQRKGQLFPAIFVAAARLRRLPVWRGRDAVDPSPVFDAIDDAAMQF